VNDYPPGLVAALGTAGPILLDFDGPVCAVFSGIPAPTIAEELRTVLASAHVEMPDEILRESDPLEVLRWSATLADDALTGRVEDALRAAELAAVESSAPTPYAREVIIAARESGRPVAIVSNNSAEAISSYLARHRLSTYVAPVVGRPYAAPDQMKPSPEPLHAALSQLDAAPAAAVLIGDSLTDITAAQAASTRVIAYANKPHKVEPFRAAGADAVVTSMVEVARWLAEHSARQSAAT
jgi:HAD superfamily hydrolase (TIGR01549 family)